MQVFTDGKGQRYVEIDNTRATIRRPDPDDDWKGCERFLNFRAYKGPDTKAMNMGPDLPIWSDHPDDVILLSVGSLLAMFNGSPAQVASSLSGASIATSVASTATGGTPTAGLS